MKKTSYYLAVIICVVGLAGCASTAQRGAVLRAHSAIEKGKYESALKRLSDGEKYVKPTPELMSEIIYLRAICYEGLERYDDAIGALKYPIDHFSDTTYAYQAKEKLRKLEERN